MAASDSASPGSVILHHFHDEINRSLHELVGSSMGPEVGLVIVIAALALHHADDTAADDKSGIELP
jgi:hypothetical protein